MKPIISKNCRIRHPDHFSAGRFSIVDDYCYFSTKVNIGSCSHIAAGCTVGGGGERLFTLGNYCSLSSGVKVWCVSDDFVNDVVTIIPPRAGNVKKNMIVGDIRIGDFCAVGANSVVMPRNIIPDGTVIGALSFVPVGFKFKPWSVYAGIPIRFIRKRNKKSVLAQVAAIESRLKNGK